LKSRDVFGFWFWVLLIGVIGVGVVAAPSVAAEEGRSLDEDPGIAAGPQSQEIRPVHREAIDIQGDIVAVETSLVGEDLLEAKVTGFMKQSRPRLENIVLMGPGVGRLSPTTRQVLRAGLEKDPPYPTKRSGLLVMNQGSERTAEGALIRERCQYQLPLEKVREAIRKKGEKARYEFEVKMTSANRGGNFKRYEFSLETLPELILSESQE